LAQSTKPFTTKATKVHEGKRKRGDLRADTGNWVESKMRSQDGRTVICARLQELGYRRERHIKLYGEEFHLVSDPVPDGDGFAIEGTSKTSIGVRRLRIPLSLVHTVKKEFALEAEPERANPVAA
jgi:hypothetical protein